MKPTVSISSESAYTLVLIYAKTSRCFIVESKYLLQICRIAYDFQGFNHASTDNCQGTMEMSYGGWGYWLLCLYLIVHSWFWVIYANMPNLLKLIFSPLVIAFSKIFDKNPCLELEIVHQVQKRSHPPETPKMDSIAAVECDQKPLIIIATFSVLDDYVVHVCAFNVLKKY